MLAALTASIGQTSPIPSGVISPPLCFLSTTYLHDLTIPTTLSILLCSSRFRLLDRSPVLLYLSSFMIRYRFLLGRPPATRPGLFGLIPAVEISIRRKLILFPLLFLPFVTPHLLPITPPRNALERRAVVPSDFFFRFFQEGSFLVGFSSIFWRESWKYGERAFRYCNHDVGHAIAAAVFAAGALGWDVKLLDGLGFKDLENVMGLGPYQLLQFPSSSPTKGRFPELEFEHPDCLLLVFPKSEEKVTVDYTGLSSAVAQFLSLEWEGTPNSLSKDHVCWDIIYRIAEAVKKPLAVDSHLSVCPFCSSVLLSEAIYKGLTVREVDRKRSAVDMDGAHIMERATFYQILLHCLPADRGLEGIKLKRPCSI